MWQAISTLLSDWHSEAAEIELRNELPGGEIHAAWHLRFGGRDYFVKCDERELLPIFTAEADQLELLSRSKTVSVPQVYAVGSDRDYSFLVMEYLPLARWTRTTPSYSVSILHICISGAISRSLVWILITTFPPRRSPTPGSAAGRLSLPNSVSAGSWSWLPKKGSASAISTASSIMCSSA